MACPAGGPESAHQIINCGDEELRYLAVSTQRAPEIWRHRRRVPAPSTLRRAERRRRSGAARSEVPARERDERKAERRAQIHDRPGADSPAVHVGAAEGAELEEEACEP